MDRFIVSAHQRATKLTTNLKSNMDRFIGKLGSTAVEKIKLFKIQYG